MKPTAIHRRARPYKEELLRRHFGKPRLATPAPGKVWSSIAAWHKPGQNVVGVGFGLKEVLGAGVAGGDAVRVYVKRKLPRKQVRVAARIPPEINGLPTDVIEVGDVRPLMARASGGSSGANGRVAYGTLGCLVRARSDPGQQFILSCNHVLAAEDTAVEGEPILEPSRTDGGSPANPIGFLQAWLQLNPTGNQVDCAIARPAQPGVFSAELRFLGRPSAQTMPATREQTVKKSGRNPPYVTVGLVTDVAADIMIPYRQGLRGFVRQIAIKGIGGLFAEPGDSGALVVDASSIRPVGLLFAGSQSITFANPIDLVLTKLRIAFV